ncbi:MAG: S-adenosylmethionine:tRNA ribosyltransferase-isomerase [Bacteroidetes bacterium]|nr:S-adenosylmethionine:tRNA ribosyltransferase-isomerase [Bacteroidota bacterium]
MPIPHLRIADYTYDLPADRIARYPLAERGGGKLLQYRDGRISDHLFAEVPSLLPSDSLLVYNDSRVIPARLHMLTHTCARIEILCLEPASAPAEQVLAYPGPCEWHCLVGNLKRWKGKPLVVEWPGGKLAATYVAPQGNVHRVRFEWTPDQLSFGEVLARLGQLPLPPYLNRAPEAGDAQAYQTVFAQVAGSVAAPTAGLHFTPAALQALADKGVQRCPLTLHVGAGTFLPVKSEELAGHPMHTEVFSVDRASLQQLATHTGPVVAVGTTTLRTLESLYWLGCQAAAGTLGETLHWPQWAAYDQPAHLGRQEAAGALLAYLDARKLDRLTGSTQILIAPGYRPRMAEGLFTNFHQPGSTLLLLIAAWVGEDWRRLYAHALAHGYRFLSYGDGSLLWRSA